MEFINNLWLLIKGLIIKLIMPLFWIIPSNHVSNNNNKTVGSNDKDGPLSEVELRQELMPRHVAVICDGNRRWAKNRGLTYVEGYKAGVKTMFDFVRSCIKFNIPVFSVFVFSAENWRRPKEELDFLLDFFEKTLRDDVPKLSHNGKVSILGDISPFPISLQQVVKNLEESTKNNTKFHLLFAMGYSGQNDIIQACKSIATKVKEGLLEPEDVTNSLIGQQLLTGISNIPNPDLLIRTSGEIRISNFYLWQSAYTELYFDNIFWPDFGEDDFVKALRSFQQRGRRFGQI